MEKEQKRKRKGIGYEEKERDWVKEIERKRLENGRNCMGFGKGEKVKKRLERVRENMRRRYWER